MSDKKKTSNNINAQKSTGPQTEAGKTVVSQNARKHGLLSRHLIIDGESQDDFNQLISELVDEFQPSGIVEHALVERVAIAFWRQRRLVQSESANVSLNRQSFGSNQAAKVRNALNLSHLNYEKIDPPDESVADESISELHKKKAVWQSIRDSFGDEKTVTFAKLSAKWQKEFLDMFKVCAEEIDAVVAGKYGNWREMIWVNIRHYTKLIELQRIREVSRLVIMGQTLPSQPELLSRYQTSLDNDLYKALKALREAQAWRQTRAVINATPVDGPE